MKEPSKEGRLAAAVVTDRGLSEKRPLNEDSFSPMSSWHLRRRRWRGRRAGR